MLITIFVINIFLRAYSEVASAPVSVPPPAPNCLTSECHSDLIEKKFLHGPVKSKGCTICHEVLTPDKSQNFKLKNHPPIKKLGVIEINQKCFVCHDEYKNKLSAAKTVHSAIEKKSCVGCHNPHQSTRNTFIALDPKKELCLSCHQEIAHKMKGASHHLINKMKEGCTSCHETHVSESPFKLLKAASPQELCLKCHAKANKTNLAHIHKPVGEGKCISCHDVHGSTVKFLLKKPYTKDNVNLCLSCHNLKNTAFRNETDNLHERHLKDSKNKKNCQTCHDSHQSQQSHLIKSEFVARGQLMPLVYKATAEGGNCTTICHKSFEYNRMKKIKNESDR